MAEDLSLSDIVAATGGNNGFAGGNGGGWIVLILLFAMIWGGGGFFGGNRNGSEAAATNADLQRAIDLNSIQQGQASIMADNQRSYGQMSADLQRGIYEINNNSNHAAMDNLGEIRDVQSAVATGNANIINNLTGLASQMQSCCCSTKQEIMENRYLDAQNASAIMQSDTANSQKVLDKLASMELANEQRYAQQLAQRVSQLELANQMAGVVRYPMNSSWAMNGNPFCGAGGCSAI